MHVPATLSATNLLPTILHLPLADHFGFCEVFVFAIELNVFEAPFFKVATLPEIRDVYVCVLSDGVVAVGELTLELSPLGVDTVPLTLALLSRTTRVMSTEEKCSTPVSTRTPPSVLVNFDSIV